MVQDARGRQATVHVSTTCGFQAAPIERRALQWKQGQGATEFEDDGELLGVKDEVDGGSPHVAVAVRQTEGYPTISTVEGRTATRGISGICTAVSRVSLGSSEGRRMERLHLGKRTRSGGK